MAQMQPDDIKILLIVLLAVSLTVSAFRMANLARQYGRRPWVWFVISLFLTALPATVVFWRDAIRARRARNAATDDDALAGQAQASRCPHCGGVLERPVDICPRCNMSIHGGDVA